MTPLNYECSVEDESTIGSIANRFGQVLPSPIPYSHDDYLAVQVAILTTHVNGCSLDLKGLLMSNSKILLSDVTGIINNIDQKTGRLGNCFLPQCKANKG